MLYYRYAQLSPTLTFVNLTPAVANAIEWVIALAAMGIGYYVFIRYYRMKQGLDLNIIFNQIPPE